jgi:hypothetical protein
LGLVVLGSWLVFRSIAVFTITSIVSGSSARNIGLSRSLWSSANEPAFKPAAVRVDAS